MFEKGYMRCRLDNVIENQSVLYTLMLFNLVAKIVQQRLKDPFRIEFIDLCKGSWILVVEIYKTLFTSSCTMHDILLCAINFNSK